MFVESPLVIDEIEIDNSCELSTRKRRKCRLSAKKPSSLRCEENFNAIDCSLRAQKWSCIFQSEHDYCPQTTSRGFSPPPKLQRESDPSGNVEVDIVCVDIEILSSDSKTDKPSNTCRRCANKVTNFFSNLSTVVDHQEIVGDRSRTNSGLSTAICEPFTVLCFCERNKPKEKELPVILPAPRKKPPEKCTPELYEKSMISLKNKLKRKAGDAALALRYIDQMKVERPDYYPNCKICDKVLSNATNLLAHYRSHAGIKPFTCKLCSASFTRRQSLQYHEMCHNDQSLYTCAKCQATFRHRSHYKDHLRKHADNNAFRCEHCSQCFGSRSSLRRHVIKCH